MINGLTYPILCYLTKVLHKTSRSCGDDEMMMMMVMMMMVAVIVATIITHQILTVLSFGWR